MGGTYFTICSIYCSPTLPFDVKKLEELRDQLPGRKMILGDFNAHHHQWGDLRCNNRGDDIADFVTHSNLSILNDGSATFVSDATGNTSVLDLSLVDPTILPDTSWNVHSDTLGSDHFPICVSYEVNTAGGPTPQRFNFKKADWGSYSRDAVINIQGNNINEKLHSIETSILRAADDNIPKISAKPTKPGVPWWKPACQQAISERYRALRRYHQQPTNINFINYKAARANARRIVKGAKRESWRSFVGTINYKTPLKKVWDTVNKIRKKKQSSNVPQLQHRGRIPDTPQDIANLLGSTFQRNSASANYHPTFQLHKIREEMEVLNFDEEDIPQSYNSQFHFEDLVSALAACTGSSPGPSGIGYDLIKHLSEVSLRKVLDFFNEIWTSRTFPDSWHFAHVVAVPKRDRDKLDPLNYRPISLTDCLCKVMERLVRSRLVFYLESNNFLSNQQCGARSGRSTLDHLVNLEHSISEALATQKVLIAAFLDIEKAYDMTWRAGLLKKLYGIGLRGNLPIFIANIIQDRSFAVKLTQSNVISDTFILENGIAQGSVLAPTLFIIMINDILSSVPQCLRLKHSLFVDDCALWSSTRSYDLSISRVQKGLDRVQEWAMKWGFKFPPHKCKVVVFSRKWKLGNTALTLNNVNIPTADSVKFLGLYFDKTLTFKDHVKHLEKITVNAVNVLKYLSGTTWGADRMSLLMLYKSLVRSKLDYGAQIYDSASETTLNHLNKIQNQCLRICLGALRCTRISRLEVEAGVPPLQDRRNYMCLSYGYKVARQRHIQSVAWQSVS